MNIMSAVVAAPALALAPPAFGRSPNRHDWELAVTRYETLTAQMKQMSNANWALHDAAEAACPRNEEFYSRYGMGHGSSRDRNFQAAHFSLVLERAKGRHLTPEEAKQTTEDALRLVDEFDDYSARHDAAFAEYDRAEDQFDALVDKQSEARRVLFDTPAPDNTALLYKIEVLAGFLTEAASEDADSLNAIHADARLILANGRA